jgi:threonine aldolase
MKIVDLRSDTVSQPTPAMREAMAQAVVGDDVYGEDPTVNRLQELSARMLGKEAGLFIPSGTMGNLAAILAHCSRGDELILGSSSHTFLYEAGGYAALGGVHPHLLPNQPDGTLALAEIEAAIRPRDVHQPVTRLVCLENTHNRCGGVSLSVEYTQAAGKLAHNHGLKLHLDGARIFNAAIAQGASARQLAVPADSVTFCLSKGLCAPVGSVLCGSEEFIARAHRIRKQLGGGMRQAGIIAAAGIVALEKMVDRLHEDHQRAARLADGLRNTPGVILDPGTPQTNMVFLNLAQETVSMDAGALDAGAVAARLADHGVLVGVTGRHRFRLVTHYWIDDADVDRAVDAFRAVLSGG